ncbi:DUF3365 domain-containing protein [Thermaurantiacus tibetensis]|uniref:Tll0287-like domain-containing protein n=1 Tax=Thermaurantiacus tibetensis TaxID=2759035 RepID=UPI001F183067|nr:DUF3365 domain-containing protein [Thermaurantiacus tibetensis]
MSGMTRRAGLAWAVAAAAPLLLVAACAPRPALSDAEEAAATALSARLADRFQAELQQALRDALARDGAAGAIGVCAEQAPAIAARLSAESGARVRRTALRNRNPAAAPDAFERDTMTAWAEAPLDAAGRPKAVTQVSAEGLRYMRAIPTGGLCLACHGAPDAIAPDVREAIAARYPADRATGFREGELRGAFSISWTLPALKQALAQQAG